MPIKTFRAALVKGTLATRHCQRTIARKALPLTLFVLMRILTDCALRRGLCRGEKAKHNTKRKNYLSQYIHLESFFNIINFNIKKLQIL
jgi:hypothetical protein